MPWIEKKLRGAKVLARCDEAGELIAEGGRVEIRYKPHDGRAYRASPGNLKPIRGAGVLPDDHCGPAEPVAKKGKAAKKAKKTKTKAAKDAAPPPHEEGAVIVYADGACSGNPGPAGLGVVILDGDEERELSEYLGRGTNNIAELTAILRAATELAGREDPVRIYTDSKYSIGVLTQGWKAKKNPELIAAVKDALASLPDVKLHYVPGHAGHDLNERADRLAREAVETRSSRGWVAA
jgi:ribonuclease HI